MGINFVYLLSFLGENSKASRDGTRQIFGQNTHFTIRNIQVGVQLFFFIMYEIGRC